MFLNESGVHLCLQPFISGYSVTFQIHADATVFYNDGP